MEKKKKDSRGEIRARDAGLGVIWTVQNRDPNSSLARKELSSSFYHSLAQVLENLVEGF